MFWEWCKITYGKTNRGKNKESSTTAMIMVKQGRGVNHLPLSRAFKQPSERVGYAQPYHVFHDVYYERTPFHICNLFMNELQKCNFLKAFLWVWCCFLGFEASSASSIYDMLNGYSDRSHPGFLLFVYANLFQSFLIIFIVNL